MSKHIKVISFVLFVTGALFLVAGLWIPAKAVVAQHLLHRAWEKTLTGSKNVKPWPWADTWPVGRLQNARLGIDQIVLEGESGEVLAFGPGHLSGSNPPGGKGHTVLAGHRDTNFRFLKDLVPGDIFVLEGRKGKMVYEVVAMEVRNAKALYFDGEEHGVLSLITCYPFDALTTGGSSRYVVSARIRDQPPAVMEH
jgi:sortase A